MAPPEHPPNIPDKLYFRIGEVSRIAGVPPTVLRFWENAFPRIRPHRTDAGQRLYRKSDVALILTIKNLLYERKFTIKGARRYLRSKRLAETDSATADLFKELRASLKQIRDLLK
jgi:DNA-binding transcriptional MerR regulator